MMKVKQPRVAAWEREGPPPTKMRQLARVLEVPLSWLWSGQTAPEERNQRPQWIEDLEAEYEQAQADQDLTPLADQQLVNQIAALPTYIARIVCDTLGAEIARLDYHEQPSRHLARAIAAIVYRQINYEQPLGNCEDAYADTLADYTKHLVSYEEAAELSNGPENDHGSKSVAGLAQQMHYTELP